MSREKTYILMCADNEVGRIGKTTNYKWSIKNKHLIPKALNTADDGAIIKDEEFHYMYPRFTSWLVNRTLSLSRSNVKALLRLFKFEQTEAQENKVKIALMFRAINLIDSFWLKESTENLTWKDVNLRVNPLAEIVSQVALTGRLIPLQPDISKSTAEMMTLGMAGKGWFRENGQIYLHKKSVGNGDEVNREVCASKVIDCFNVYGNLKYELSSKYGENTSRCELMATEEKSIVPAYDMMLWCKRNNIDFMQFINDSYIKEYSQMAVIDYLIANYDRHEWNWGFYQDTVTGEITGMHELYDHNQAFNDDYLENEDLESLLNPDFSQKDLAWRYLPASRLSLITVPAIEMFPNKNAYDVFKRRCNQLNLWNVGE